MSSRVLRALPSLTLGLAAMALAAYALGRLTRSEWMWWLAPLTVALDGSLLLLRSRRGDSVALVSPSDDNAVADPDLPVRLASSVAATGLAAVGAYSGNRLALVVGAAVAIVGYVLDQGEEQAWDEHRPSGIIRFTWPARRVRKPWPSNHLKSDTEGTCSCPSS